MKNITIYLSCVVVTLMLLSCSSSDEPSDPRIITDDSGLDIDLEWTTGGSISQSQNDTDLDLKIRKGTTTVDYAYSLSFEKVQLLDIYADGEYIIELEVASIAKATSYTVFFSGIKSNEVKQYQGSVSTSEKGSIIEFIRITKSGKKYTLSR
jgi:hypothetical protein